MAESAPVNQPTSSKHRAAQIGLYAKLIAEVNEALRDLDLNDLGHTYDGFIRLITAIIRRYSKASSSLAVRFYRDMRREAGHTTEFTVRPSQVPGAQEIEQAIRYEVRDYFGRTPEDPPPPPRKIELVEKNIEGQAQKLVADTGRKTILENVKRDKAAVGWARVTDGDPCSFCAMLASRGAVYSSEESASTVLNEMSSRYGESYHPHCDCTVVPIFKGQDFTMSEDAKKWRDLWDRVTAGKSGKDARREFRKALEASRPSA